MLNTQTRPNPSRPGSVAIASRARMAVVRSPYSRHSEGAWQVRRDDSRDQERQPNEAEAMQDENRPQGVRAGLPRKAGQTYSRVTTPHATKAIAMLSPNKACKDTVASCPRVFQLGFNPSDPQARRAVHARAPRPHARVGRSRGGAPVRTIGGSPEWLAGMTTHGKPRRRELDSRTMLGRVVTARPRPFASGLVALASASSVERVGRSPPRSCPPSS